MKYLFFAMFALLIAAGGAVGYLAGDTLWCVIGILLAMIICLALILALRRFRPEIYSRISEISSPGHSCGGNDKYPARRETPEITPRPLRHLPFLKSKPLGSQGANRVKRFWCYRSADQTLFFVRLRSGKLYCFYMRRATSGEGARWIVHKIEGEEYGNIAKQAQSIIDQKRSASESHDLAPRGAR